MNVARASKRSSKNGQRRGQFDLRFQFAVLRSLLTHHLGIFFAVEKEEARWLTKYRCLPKTKPNVLMMRPTHNWNRRDGTDCLAMSEKRRIVVQ